MRPVHYRPYGARVMFDCYRKAIKAHIDSGVKDAGISEPNRWQAPTTHYSVPMPLAHSSLDAVTCRDCWREIARMARERLNGAG